jgi:hypothetical protein
MAETATTTTRERAGVKMCRNGSAADNPCWRLPRHARRREHGRPSSVCGMPTTRY